MGRGCIWRLIKWTFFIAVVVFLFHFWITNKSYLISEDDLEAIAKRYVGDKGPIHETFLKIHEELRQKYPGHILPKEDLQWLMYNAGGWMASICVLHATLTEYIMFLGTPLETSGHSGRFWANYSSTLIAGEIHEWPEGTAEVRIYKPGDTVKYTMGEASGLNLKAGTWSVEYGRGFIPSTMPIAFADTLFSTLDFVNGFYTIKVGIKVMVMEAGYYITHPEELFA